MSTGSDAAIERIRMIVGETDDILLRDVARLAVASYERIGEITVSIEALTAAAARVQSEVGQTGAIVDALRAAVDTLTAQVAQGQIDAAAVEAVTAQLTAAADALDAQGNDPAVVVEPPVEPPA